MKRLSRWIAYILVMGMFAQHVFAALPVHAYTAHSRQEAIAWIEAQNGQSLDYDGAYGAQCVDLILSYYAYLGVATVSGNAKDYAWNALPTGWQRINNYSGFVPQPGDIFVSTAGEYGHVGLVLSGNASNFTAMNQNYNWNPRCERTTFNTSYISCVIRPDFSDSTPAQDPWIEMWDVTDITETDAKLNANIRNPGGAYISTVGCTILDYNSQVLTTHYEPMNPKFHTADNVRMWFWMNSEVGMTLTKGTLYKYQLLIIRSDEKTFYSDIFSFQTAGSHALNFHPEGGSCDTTSKQVINGAPVGDLPIPQRPGYSFDGWYQGNTRVTADSLFLLSNGQDLYARWIQDALPGDLDHSGDVNIADVMEACKVMAREAAGTDPTADEMVRGDLDRDHQFTIADVMEICKILARKS